MVVDVSEFLYEKVAVQMAAQIRAGNLRPGDKHPSVRQVCRQYGVSLSTAVQALALLEERGLIEARPQSGFYVRTLVDDAFHLGDEAHLPRRKVTPARVETADLIDAVMATARDPDSVPLGAATVAVDLLPGAGLRRSLAWATRSLGADGLGYEMSPGNEELRRQIALHALSAGCRVDADDIVVTSGSMEAIALSLRAVTRPGDTVAVESPMFFGIMELLAASSLKVAEIATHPVHGMDLDCLAEVMQSRKIAAVLSIPNFNNPLGSRMPDEAKRALVELLARENVPLIEDDIYGDLQHDGERPVAAKSYDKSGIVLYCSSVSKTLSPGLRVGWVIPGRFQAEIQRLKFVSTIATSTIPQAAVAHFLAHGGYYKHLRRLRRELATRLQHYTHAIHRLFPLGTKVSQPLGGFVLWVRFPDGVDAIALYERARELGIGIVPGPAFSSVLGNYKSCIRLSCGAALTRTMEKALEQLGAAAAAQLAGE